MDILTVATFNCEWRGSRTRDADLIRQRVFAGPVDVVCLTETQRDFLDGEGHTIASVQFETRPRFAARRKVLLWSRSPWTDVDAAGPSGMPEARYAAGTTTTSAGVVRVVGVVIPYRFAAVRYGEPRRAPWEEHLRYLDALGASLPAAPERTVLLGDLNQRVPRRYQPRPVFDALNEAVLGRLPIATAGVLEPIGRQAIDHVCHSRDFVCRGAASISNSRPDGGEISDHFGVQVELATAPNSAGD